MSARTTPPAKLDDLRPLLRGDLLGPEHEAYASARRLWNGAFDRKPAAIVRCRDVADVVAAVKHARAAGLALTVRAGGHGIAGSALADGALAIDLSAMRGVHVDADARRVWVQGGALWGDVDHATQLFGLAVPGGFVSTTGVGGFTLGGGIAWTSRKLGLACDQLLEAEVVTANGDVLRVNAKEHPDLLWALRGAGGNFGVVTSFTFRAQPVGPMVFGGLRLFPIEAARSVLRLVADLYERTPEDLNLLANLTTAPAAPFLPPSLHGKRVAGLAVCYTGPPEDGPRVAREALELPGAIFEHIGPLPYTALQSAFDATEGPGMRNYWKSSYANALPEPAVDTVLRQFGKVPSPLTELHFQYFGGAVSRVAAEHSAIGNRESPFLFNLIGKWSEAADTERNIAWVRETWDSLQPFSSGGVYTNFLTDQSAAMTRAAYGPEVYRRLVAIKKRYDPENVFKGSHNIDPSRAEA